MGKQPDGVLLAYMPLGLVQIPSLGLSLLKAGLREAAIDCRIRYFNLDFADRFCPGRGEIAAQDYVAMTSRYPVNFLAEACFARQLHGDDPGREQLYASYLEGLRPSEREWLSSIDAAVSPFIEWCLRDVDWDALRIVGLSSTFIGQTIPSLLLAQRIKSKYPHLTVVLGGSNTEGEMGVELLRRSPYLDYVLRGESDESFPVLCASLLAGSEPGEVAGLVRRAPFSGEVVATPSRLVREMDSVPPPDFDDWLEQAPATSFGDRYRRKLELPFESSRGCWWGEVSHCLFCGINGDSMGFRAKSPDRMRAELDQLVEKYSPTLLVAADSILDHRYYATLLRDLAERPIDVDLSYEIKANVNRKQVEALSAARVVDVVPGIEALSTPLLDLIGKGATAISNLLCLRLAEEFGIAVTWYHLCGLPGERRIDYQKEIELLTRIHHLRPPREIARFTLQRFSPYWAEPEKHRIKDVHALELYRAVFPYEQGVLDRLAYNFDFVFADGRGTDDTSLIESMLERAVLDWQADYGHVRLDAMPLADGMVILDTRFDPSTLYRLDADAAWVYGQLQNGSAARSILRRFEKVRVARSEPDPEEGRLSKLATECASAFGARLVELPTPFSAAGAGSARDMAQDLAGFLESLEAAGLVYTEGAKSIALAVPRATLSDRRWQEIESKLQELVVA